MAQETSRRVQRFEKEVRQLSAEFLISGLKTPLQGIPTVTRSQVSPDLRSARVYVNFIGSECESDDLKALQNEAHRLQKFIHSNLRSKFCPKILFMIDKSYHHVLKVEKILHEISGEFS